MAEISQIKPNISTEHIVTKIAEKPREIKAIPTSPIGVFDSGVGGLTVLTEIMKQLPNENVIYIADTARVPYGGRAASEIIKINHQIISYLVGQGVKMIIMACGTSSAIAYPVIKDRYRIPIISMVEPGARLAATSSKNKKIGLIATIGTVESGAYQSALRKSALGGKKDIEVYAAACPLFVPLIEGGFIDSDETKKVAKIYLRSLIRAGVDTIILGCTHYPHLINILIEIMGAKVTFINPAEEVVIDANKILTQQGILNNKSKKTEYAYLVTGSVVQFQELGSRLMGKPITGAKKLDL